MIGTPVGIFARRSSRQDQRFSQEEADALRRRGILVSPSAIKTKEEIEEEEEDEKEDEYKEDIRKQFLAGRISLHELNKPFERKNKKQEPNTIKIDAKTYI